MSLAGMQRPAPKTIIDLGCGKSQMLEVLHGMFPEAKCIGIDWAVEAVRENILEYPWGSWRHGNVDEPPIPGLGDGIADLVYSSHVLEHVANPYLLLDEKERLCKKGGMIAVIVPLHMHSKDHRRVFTGEDILGILRLYGQPVICYTDMRQSEMVAGVIKP